jgi:hypothetical protein
MEVTHIATKNVARRIMLTPTQRSALESSRTNNSVQATDMSGQ